MKKAMAVFLALTVLAFTGCSSSKTESSQDNANAAADEVAAESTDGAGNEETDSETVTEETNEQAGNEVKVVGDPIPENLEAIPAFVTEDLGGNEVTEAIFADKDVTMVNVWGTFCGPCIGEMADLQKLSDSLPENAQMVGLVADVNLAYKDSLDSAKEIADENGVTFTNLIMDESLTGFTRNFQFVPTTLFVDSEGRLIGSMIIGASFDQYVEQLEALLEGWNYAG